MALGRRDDEPDETRFNMAVMGLRLAARRNGVAGLHGAVSRAMFAGLWPDVPTDEVPIGSVTNGVHAPTWISPEVDDLLTRRVVPEWDGAPAEDWARIGEVGDDELLAGPAAGSRAPRRLRAEPPARVAAGPGVLGQRRGLDERRARPDGVHHRLRPALRHLQAGHAPALPARAAASPPLPRRPAGPDDLRRQGPPGRPAGQVDDPADPAVRRPARAAPPLRVPGRLRHGGGPGAVPGRPTSGSTPRGGPRRHAGRAG